MAKQNILQLTMGKAFPISLADAPPGLFLTKLPGDEEGFVGLKCAPLQALGARYYRADTGERFFGPDGSEASLEALVVQPLELHEGIVDLVPVQTDG
jgi:hypothetical protein